MKAKRIEKVLVTGGLGFIGSHIVDLLIEKGYEVKLLDNLEPQVHGTSETLPEYYNKNAFFIKGDVRNRDDLISVVNDVDVIIHLAAIVGIGQSMYQIEKYVSYNTYGTANLLDIVINQGNCVKKLIIASSMSIYGEGEYECEDCGVVYPRLRGEKQVLKKDWEPECPKCGKNVKPLPTDENKTQMPMSIYAQTKRHQEEMCLLIGKTYGIPTVALRYFNVYGPRQSLRNPYTGVVAIFINRLLNRKSPYIFEDGNQTRDFVHVKDVAGATVLALEKSAANYEAINVGTGIPTSIRKLAEKLVKLNNFDIKPYISNRYRKGDVRHCFANISKAERLLDYKPAVTLEEGLKGLIKWAKTNDWQAIDLFGKALKELEDRKTA